MDALMIAFIHVLFLAINYPWEFFFALALLIAGSSGLAGLIIAFTEITFAYIADKKLELSE